MTNAPSGAALLLDLIRSDQMTAEQVEHLLEDNPDFAAWFSSTGQPPCAVFATRIA